MKYRDVICLYPDGHDIMEHGVLAYITPDGRETVRKEIETYSDDQHAEFCSQLVALVKVLRLAESPIYGT